MDTFAIVGVSLEWRCVVAEQVRAKSFVWVWLTDGGWRQAKAGWDLGGTLFSFDRWLFGRWMFHGPLHQSPYWPCLGPVKATHSEELCSIFDPQCGFMQQRCAQLGLITQEHLVLGCRAVGGNNVSRMRAFECFLLSLDMGGEEEGVVLVGVFGAIPVLVTNGGNICQ